MLRACVLAFLLACGGALPGAAAIAASPDEAQPATAQVPVDARGARMPMTIQFHKPPGAGPFPVVIHLHGRGLNREQRAGMRQAVDPEHVQRWLRRGVAVVAPVRIGYGATGGPDLEDTGSRWQGGHCKGEPQFTRVAMAARDSAVAAHRWVRSQPWASKDHILVEGYSFGGLAAAAVAGGGLPGVKGVINFSGGTAGNPVDAPGRSCRPDLMADAYRQMGRQARVPSLWLYAANDRYWGEQAPRAWHEAFEQGGSDTQLVVTPPLEGSDGHSLMADAPALWEKPVAEFVRRIGFLP